jgi:hypothetical protein
MTQIPQDHVTKSQDDHERQYHTGDRVQDRVPLEHGCHQALHPPLRISFSPIPGKPVRCLDQPKSGSTATGQEPQMSRKAEVENAERLKTGVLFNPQPFCFLQVNYG